MTACRHLNTSVETMTLPMMPPRVSQRTTRCLDCGAVWVDVPCVCCGRLMDRDKLDEWLAKTPSTPAASTVEGNDAGNVQRPEGA